MGQPRGGGEQAQGKQNEAADEHDDPIKPSAMPVIIDPRWSVSAATLMAASTDRVG